MIWEGLRGVGRIPFEASAFSMQKLGNEPSHYEDSFCCNLRQRKLAVADGASESCFAKLWADLLTRCFVESDLSLFHLASFEPHIVEEAFKPILALARQEWREKIDWVTLPWYVEEKAKQGAFATFLGVESRRLSGKRKRLYRWRAVAVGDCCLFHINDEELLGSFPIVDNREFGVTPCLLSSRGSVPGKPWNVKEGTIRGSEKLLLATDAVAKWILQETEKGRKTWLDVISAQSDSKRLFLEKLVNREEMRNDDITILTLGLQRP